MATVHRPSRLAVALDRGCLHKVLLLKWMENLSFGENYELFDLFSGAGNVGKLW